MHQRGHELRFLAIASILASVLATTASSYKNQRIASGLEPLLSEHIDEEIFIGDVEVSLLGTLIIKNVKVGKFFYAPRAEASVDLAALFTEEIVIEEIRLQSPEANLNLDRRHIAATRNNWANKASRKKQTPKPTLKPTLEKNQPSIQTSSLAKMPRIFVSEGRLTINFENGQSLRLRDVRVLPLEHGVRIISGLTQFALAHGEWTLQGTFKKVAADFDFHKKKITRAMSSGGRLRLSDEYGTAIEVENFLAVKIGESLKFKGAVKDGQGAGGRLIGILGNGDSGVHLNLWGVNVPLDIASPLLPAGFDSRDAFGSGQFEFRRHLGKTEIHVAGSFARVKLNHRTIAEKAVPFDGETNFRLTYQRDKRGLKIKLHEMDLAVGYLKMKIAGHGRWEPGKRIPSRGAFTLTIPNSPCADILYSVPFPLREHLYGMSVGGETGIKIALSFDNRSEDGARLLNEINLDACEVFRDPIAADIRDLKRPYSHILPNGQERILGRMSPSYQSIFAMHKHVYGAFTSAEDANFFRHNGFDDRQIERSLGINLHKNRLLRGGSTISQQLIKNLFLSPKRNFARKFQEAILTWRMEKVLNKRQILERYLNIIQLGIGVYGIVDAGKYWFGKRPHQFSIRESAFLASITSSPTTTTRRIAASGHLDAQSEERVNIILRNMYRNQVITKYQLIVAQRTRLRFRDERLMVARGDRL